MRLQHSSAASLEHSRLNDHLRGDKSSKCFEGMPAFELPVLSRIFLVESFLFQINWIKPCIFFREVRMKCLCRFILRCRGSHDPRSLHALWLETKDREDSERGQSRDLFLPSVRSLIHFPIAKPFVSCRTGLPVSRLPIGCPWFPLLCNFLKIQL